jgi:hypothetical protein
VQALILDAAVLEKAIHRHWFRTPADEGIVLVKLPLVTQQTIVADAARIQQELRGTTYSR